MQQVDLAGDDMVFPITNSWFLQVYNWNALNNENSQDIRFPFRTCYQIIRNANTIINATDAAIGTTADKNIVKGRLYYTVHFVTFNWCNCMVKDM